MAPVWPNAHQPGRRDRLLRATLDHKRQHLLEGRQGGEIVKKLKVKEPDGSWAWVFCRRMPEKALVTTPNKQHALPHRAIEGAGDLVWAKGQWPDRVFELGAEL